jgi:hypothetical protein
MTMKKNHKSSAKLIFSMFTIVLLATLLMAAGLANTQEPTPSPTLEITATPEITLTLPPSSETPGDDETGQISIPTTISHPIAEGKNSCFDCHVELDEKNVQISQAWQLSVHGKAEIGCADCHGGDPSTNDLILSMSSENSFIGDLTRNQTPGICGGCHSDVERMRQYNLPTDQYAKYIQSIHGAKIKEGDISVAICVDCHGSHDVKKVADPTSAVYPLNIPALCASCHSETALMEPYKIPTNQLEVYEESVHGVALLVNNDLRSPSCASCHGSHAAKPPTSDEVVNVCGKCHTATQDFYEESRHSKIEQAAPKCWTCHGTHDVYKPDDTLYINPEPPDQTCSDCHLDAENIIIERTSFGNIENRRCDTCHHSDSTIYKLIKGIRDALADADQAYWIADGKIHEASLTGMIVTDAEVVLAEAKTSLITARAFIHTTKIPLISELTASTIESANSAYQKAEDKIEEHLFRRQAMIVVIVVISINIATLSVIKKKLDETLER